MAERLSPLVNSRDLSRERIEELFERAKLMDGIVRKGEYPATDRKRIVNLVFEEPSILTRRSFEIATVRLGWHPSITEVTKETMWETSLQNEVEMLNALEGHLIVLRSHEAGKAAEAALYSEVPIINAGESFNANDLVIPVQHPTQALGDLYTIGQHFSTLNGLNYVFVGDLRSNPVVNSMLFNLGQFQPRSIVLVSKAGSFQIHQEIETYLADSSIKVIRTKNLDEQLSTADVVYFAEPKYPHNRPDIYRDTIEEKYLELLPKDSVVLDSMLRGEITQFRYHPKVIWRSQISNGTILRMAAMDMAA